MEKLISKQIQSDLTKLGIYQIAGGAIGVLLIFWGIYNAPLLTGLTGLIYFFMLAFFAYSIFCGTLCIKAKKKALGHSLANQILQVIGFAIMGFAFKYVAGLYLTVGLNLTDSVTFDFGAGLSKFDLNFNNEKERLELDFNLIAFGLIYWIEKLRKKIRTEIELRQISSIGAT